MAERSGAARSGAARVGALRVGAARAGDALRAGDGTYPRAPLSRPDPFTTGTISPPDSAAVKQNGFICDETCSQTNRVFGREPLYRRDDISCLVRSVSSGGYWEARLRRHTRHWLKTIQRTYTHGNDENMSPLKRQMHKPHENAKCAVSRAEQTCFSVESSVVHACFDILGSASVSEAREGRGYTRGN